MSDVFINNQRVKLNSQIGKGGEGTIFTTDRSSDEAVKIYHPEIRSSRYLKIKVMVGKNLASKTNLISFPKEIVNDKNGNFLGFTMKLVKGFRPIHELYNPKSRQQYFPKADYRFVINTALNVTRAIGTVHENGCIVGDLNHSGILVSENSTVALIDADSFQISDSGETYYCVVGVPEFTPPELQGKNLKSVKRLIEHDNFGLAVTLFQLLFMGKHPYAGIFKQKDLSMVESIQQNRFAYSRLRQSSTLTSPPPATLTLDNFDGLIAEGFEHAFGLDPKKRPNAREWLNRLTSISNKIVKCQHSQSHYFLANKQGCFWCDLQALLNFDYFPQLFTGATYAPQNFSSLNDLIKFIQKHKVPEIEQLIKLPPPQNTNGSSDYKSLVNANNSKKIFGYALIAGLIAMFFIMPNLWFVWLIAVMFCWGNLGNAEVDKNHFDADLRQLISESQSRIYALLKISNSSEIIKIRTDLQAIIEDFNEQDKARDDLITKVRSQRKQIKLFEFLDRHYIKDANIVGIGPSKKRTLIYAGIETAADVDRHKILRISGFGPTHTSNIIEWRRKLESKFSYNPNSDASDIKLENTIRGFFDHNKKMLSDRIKNGADQIKKSWHNINNLERLLREDLELRTKLQKISDLNNDIKLLGKDPEKADLTIINSYNSSYIKLNRTPPNLPNLSGFSASSSSSSQTKTATTITGPNRKTKVKTSSTSRSPTCPRCSNQMVTRNGRYGMFWGCTNYPRCKGTRNI